MNAEDVNKKSMEIRKAIAELEDMALAVATDAIFNADQGQEAAYEELWNELKGIRECGSLARLNSSKISFLVDKIFENHKDYYGDDE